MTRKALLAALALACALPLAACNPSDLTPLANAAATTSPTLPPSAVVSEVLTASGVSAATQAKVNANIAAVQRAAVTLCGIRPLASGVLNIGIALSPSIATVAESGIAQQVRGAATIACNALAVAPAYSTLGGDRLVRGIARVNGLDVPVYGVRVR
jgi:hypothetical protein